LFQQLADGDIELGVARGQGFTNRARDFDVDRAWVALHVCAIVRGDLHARQAQDRAVD
jgi:hypothetical protein